MNITRAFVTYMEAEGYGTFGDDLFIGNVPLEAPETAWWVVSSGGGAVIKNETGEKLKSYTVNVFYRSTSAEDVYDTLQEFEEAVNTGNCDQLGIYDTIEMEAITYPTDQDIDAEDRTVGLIEVNLTVYKGN